MNTLTNGLLKRALSILLVTIMVFSLGIVGITTTSAAETELVDTGADVTYAVGDYIYIRNFKPSGWTATWFFNDVYEWAVFYDSSNNQYPFKFELIEGTENAVDAIYGAKITTAGTYTKVVFTRSKSDTNAWYMCNQTGAILLDSSINCYTGLSAGNATYEGSFYTPGSSGGTTVTGFWVDLDGDASTTIDRIYAEEDYYESNKYNHDVYFVCLPSSVKAAYDAGDKTVKVFVSEGSTLTIQGHTISTNGTELDLTTIGSNPALGGSFTGYVYFKFSAGVSSIHTITEKDIPQTKGIGDSKDSYNSENDPEGTGTDTQFIKVIGPDGTVKNSDNVLDKVKGRGNSSWKASNQEIGKYAFNITLDKKANLLGSGETKKYCLVSYNADQARIRNMIAYDLADKIGLEFSPKFEPVDFYNNGHYIGSYLLTDKVEIGDDEAPLVNIVNLDDVNKGVSAENKAICKNPTNHRKAGKIELGTYNKYNNVVVNNLNLYASSEARYFKYVNMTEPDESIYQDSGFLLEFELDERFKDEISGFISNEGQQIVCKYPENATKNQMLFIMGKWNEAEDIIYNGVDGKPATYEQLDRVIDVESFAKMYLLQELSKNVDAGSTSYYVYYHDGKLHAGVAWDFDWAFGQYTENGEDNKKVAAQTMGDFITDGVSTLDKTDGWWANSREIYPDLNKLNVQAKLCHNENFWNVVKAEWNELFYSTAKSYVTSSAISSSTISAMANDTESDNISSVLLGGIKDFYDLVHPSTLIDEYKWGIIATNPLTAWMSADTGENHNQAVANLNNFILNRLNWMNTGATKYHLKSTDYTIQPPVLSLATDMPEGGFDINTEVTINIEDKTDGSYNYRIYKNGEFDSVTTDKSFTVKAENGEFKYTVEALSKNTGLSSAQSTAVTVKGTGYPITPSLKVSSNAVLTGDTVTLTPSITENYTDVAYKIYYSVDGGEPQLLTGTIYTQDVAGEVQFYVEATATVAGETVFGSTETKPVKVTFSEFSIKVTTSGNGTVMQSQNVTIKATPSVEGDVTYTFYKNGEVITDYENVTTNTYTEKMDDAGSFVYKVVANYAGRPAEGTVTVTVQAYTGTFNVKILFKSSTVGAYRPNMKINGETVTVEEETAIEVDKVGDGISTYRWFSYTLPGDQTYGTPITVEVEGNRDYFYKASYSFEVGNTDYPYDSADGFTSYYFALDNLNKRGGTLSNLSGLEAYVRNWTQSATHMIYNDKYDGELSAPVGFSFRFADYGDANCDGKINIKDATYVQKSLANIVKADTLSTTVSDYNRDGKVTIKDATAIQKRIAGL